MYNVKLYNKISKVGLDDLDAAKYTCSEDFTDYDAVLVRSAKLHEVEFSKNLKCIARAGAGVNNIPIDRCSQEGIVVFNTPGANANAVKELVICALLLASRKVVQGANWVKSLKGTPDIGPAAEKGKSTYAGPEIAGKKLGIIGLGGIGQTVAGIANAFGMKVSAWNSHVPAQVFENLNVTPVEDMNELISNSDVVSVHMPLLDSTRGIITAKNLDALRPGTLFVNTARAEVIEPGALLARLQRGDIPAALDVFDHEPLAADDPLCKIPGIVLTPHIAWRTDGAYIGMTKQVVQSIAAFFKGEEFNVVV